MNKVEQIKQDMNKDYPSLMNSLLRKSETPRL